MSPLHPLAATALWSLLCLPDSLAFDLARRDLAGTQRRLLLRLLRRNAGTAFGRRYRFATIDSVDDYRNRVPLATYDDYREAIERIGAGQRRVLTREPVLLFEPTGGSTAPTKLIPYTAALKAEFGRAIAPWMVDLYRHDPALMRGQAYWSISPVARRDQRTAGGIPIGFEVDSEYFGRLQRALIDAVMAVPSAVRLIDDVEAFRYATLLFLLRSRSLVLISVWSPAFLSLLVGRLPAWWPRLADDIADGRISPPTPIPTDVLGQLRRLNPPDRRRATEIRAAFAAGGEPGAIHSQVWPRLRLISCWTDANAARDVPQLTRLFPQARIQGKGLLATEGVVSFPLVGQVGAALAIRSHFFEFSPINGGDPRLAHELELGQEYALAITTGGGLYRYQLHDVVRVVGRAGGCPLIRFIGKEHQVSDRFGEKLNERHVRAALDRLLANHELAPTFAMLAREDGHGRSAYTLFIEAHEGSDEALRALGCGLEVALCENYHYRYCRDLGQLDPVRVFRVAGDARDTYLAICSEHGQRLGDVKPVALHPRSGWSHAFRGQLLPPDPEA